MLHFFPQKAMPYFWLSLWSVISNESSLFFGTAKSDAMNQEGVLRRASQRKYV